eukprot:m51a1_g9681 hypothetical protein (332) ;mRNA; f:1297097-1298249
MAEPAADIWKTVDSLEAIIRAKDAFSQSLLSELQECRSESQRLRKELEDLRSERSRQSAQLCDIQSRVSAIVCAASENESLRSQVKDLEQRLASVSSLSSDLESKCARLASSGALLEDQLRQARSQLASSASEVQSLNDARTLKRRADEWERERVSLREASEKLALELQRAEQLRDQELQKQRVKLQQDAMRAEAGLAAEMSVSQELRDRLEKEKQATQRLQEELLRARQSAAPAPQPQQPQQQQQHQQHQQISQQDRQPRTPQRALQPHVEKEKSVHKATPFPPAKCVRAVAPKSTGNVLQRTRSRTEQQTVVRGSRLGQYFGASTPESP